MEQHNNNIPDFYQLHNIMHSIHQTNEMSAFNAQLSFDSIRLHCSHIIKTCYTVPVAAVTVISIAAEVPSIVPSAVVPSVTAVVTVVAAVKVTIASTIFTRHDRTVATAGTGRDFHTNRTSINLQARHFTHRTSGVFSRLHSYEGKPTRASGGAID